MELDHEEEVPTPSTSNEDLLSRVEQTNGNKPSLGACAIDSENSKDLNNSYGLLFNSSKL